MTAMTYDPKVCREITDLQHDRRILKCILLTLEPEQDSRLLEARIAAIEARIEALMRKNPHTRRGRGGPERS